MNLAKYEPWEQIGWPLPHQQRMFASWGEFYNNKGLSRQALKYFDKAHELDPKDAEVLYNRSLCKANLARNLEAFTDASAAHNLMPTNAKMLRGALTARYEMNEFEDTKRLLHNAQRMTAHKRKSEKFRNALGVVESHLEDCLGESLHDFFGRNEKILKATSEEIENRKNPDMRPLWKILREMDKCDVKSTLEQMEELVPPLEIARRQRARKIFKQNYYIGRAWKDVMFLNNLRSHPCLDLPNTKLVRTELKRKTDETHAIVMKYVQMLHARSPLYHERWRKCSGHSLCEESRNKNLFHIQYQTRRNMITVLRTARHMRTMGDLEKLEKYVEEIMGEYVVLKTDRVMPWKFEFINEMYNILALAYSDEYKVPADDTDAGKLLFGKNLQELLKVVSERPTLRYDLFVFGDRSTYPDTQVLDLSLAKFKRHIARYEKRLLIAKYPIERAYLRYSIAKSQFAQGYYDECRQTARKALEEAKVCNSLLWQFLTVMLVCKAHAILRRVERTQEALEQAYMLARRIKSYQLCKYVQACSTANTMELLKMKLSRSIETTSRRRRTKLSGSHSMTLSMRSSESIVYVSNRNRPSTNIIAELKTENQL